MRKNERENWNLNLKNNKNKQIYNLVKKRSDFEEL